MTTAGGERETELEQGSRRIETVYNEEKKKQKERERDNTRTFDLKLKQIFLSAFISNETETP